MSAKALPRSPDLGLARRGKRCCGVAVVPKGVRSLLDTARDRAEGREAKPDGTISRADIPKALDILKRAGVGNPAAKDDALPRRRKDS